MEGYLNRVDTIGVSLGVPGHLDRELVGVVGLHVLDQVKRACEAALGHLRGEREPRSEMEQWNESEAGDQMRVDHMRVINEGDQ